MRFLLDESGEFRIASFLTDQGHDVTAIAHDYPNALTDRRVLEIARAEQRILLTNDSDFGGLVFQEHQLHSGVVYFRFPAATAEEKCKCLAEVLVSHHGELHHFLVVTPQTVRVRRRS